MKTFLRNVCQLIGAIDRPDLVVRVMATHPTPEQLKPGVLVIVRDGTIEKWACMMCPGGCGEKIMLSLSRNRRPHWAVTEDWLGRPSLSPSVWQRQSCGCHFWVRNGRVDWCADSPRSQTKSARS
jgi:hypothetical protein